MDKTENADIEDNSNNKADEPSENDAGNTEEESNEKDFKDLKFEDI